MHSIKLMKSQKKIKFIFVIFYLDFIPWNPSTLYESWIIMIQMTCYRHQTTRRITRDWARFFFTLSKYCTKNNNALTVATIFDKYLL